MPTGWIVSNVALWVVVLFETVLLLLLLRALGELKQSISSSQGYGQPQDTMGIALGEQAPSFLAKNHKGDIVRFEDFAGRKRILAFISPGCADCKFIAEAINSMPQDEQYLDWIVVGGLDSESNNSYAVENHLRIPVLTPQPGLNADVYHIQAIPFVFLIDEIGIIRAKGIVTQPDQLRKLLATAFPTTPVLS